MLARRYDEALKETDRIQKLIPDNKNILFIPWIVYLLKGENKKMADISQKMMTASSTIITKNSIIGSEHAVLWNHDEAIKQLRILEEDYNSHFAGENSIALLNMLLGDFDKTFEWLEKAYDARSSRLTDIYNFPEWDPIRSDPRYTELIRKMGFPID